MKRFLYITVAVVMVISSYGKLHEKIGQVNERVYGLESRVKILEELCKQMNTNITSLKSLVSAVENKDYVTNVAPVEKDGIVIGYTISFTKSNTITIYHGRDGEDGEEGDAGEDGMTPVIGVRLDSDGLYYWTLNGKWLLDAEDNKVKAAGTDGEDGKEGATGEEGEAGSDGITPKLKIENEFWYVSYDNGITWTELGKASGSKGEQGDSFFKNVTQDGDNIYMTLSDGTLLTIPLASSCLMNRIQSVTYIPRYSDGKVHVSKISGKDQGIAEFDFKVSPKDVAVEIADCWDSVLSVNAVYTLTRGIGLIDMPVISCIADATNGIITVRASGENLSEDFFTGNQEASAALSISDGV